MSFYNSALVLLKDVSAIDSYNTLFESAARNLTEDGSLDILILSRIARLDALDQHLAAIYSLADEILQRVEKTHVDVKVLFGEHYLEISSPDWELLVLDSSTDECYDEFLYEGKEDLDFINVQRSAVQSKKIGLIEDESEESVHEVAAVGGTFDHFHVGHKILLTAAAFLTKSKLIVGVTDQELLENKKYKEFLQSYDHRVLVLTKFLNHIKPKLEIEPIAIRDVCGPTGYIEDIDALIVSRETVSGGDFVNKTRKEKGFHELRIHVINVLGGKEEDGFQNKLSSTQLRKEQFEASKKEHTE